jgi:hypothetical protein
MTGMTISCSNSGSFALEDTAIGTDKNFRFDLPEPVEYGLYTEFGRAQRPNGANAIGGQHEDERIDDVW